MIVNSKQKKKSAKKKIKEYTKITCHNNTEQKPYVSHTIQVANKCQANWSQVTGQVNS